MTKSVVGLDHCHVFRPDGFDGRVEVVTAGIKLRSFPARLSLGLGVCLKTGPAHVPVADGRPTDFPADAIVVRPPGCIWSSPPTISGFLALDIDPTLLPADANYRRMTAYVPERLPSLPSLISALGRADSKLGGEQLLFAYIEALVREGFARSDVMLTPSTLPALRRVRDYLIDNHHANVGLDELARQAGANKFVLARTFRRQFGITPHAFQIQVRLARARELICRGTPIGEAAALVGFADQSHFGRHFKNNVGLTPAAYTRRARSVA